MKRRWLLAVLFLMLSVVAFVLVTPTDPLDKYRSADGSLTIPGGELTPELQRLLSRPTPEPVTTLTVWQMAPDADTSASTASWISWDYDRVNENVFVQKPVERLDLDIGGTLANVTSGAWRVVTDFLSFDWLIGTASAATRTWDGGGGADTNWNTAANWTGPNIVPIAGDAAVFDATSTNNCTMNVAVPALLSLSVNAGYTGTITVTVDQTTASAFGAATFANAFTFQMNTTTAGDATTLTMSNGTVTGTGLRVFNVRGNVSITGGTWSGGYLQFGAAGNLSSTVTFGDAAGEGISIGLNAASFAVTQTSAITTYEYIQADTTTYNKGTNTLTVNADFAMSGNSLFNSTSGNVSITGSVTITGSTPAMNFGSETWTVSGTWTNASSDAGGWDAGTGTMLFNSTTDRTMTWGEVGDEFYHVTFSSTSASPVTFTTATRGIQWEASAAVDPMFTVSDSVSTTTFVSSGFHVLGRDMTIGNGGIATLNNSAVNIDDFIMTGGTSGTLTVTTGLWLVSGNWTSTGAGSVFSEGTTANYEFDGVDDTTPTIQLLSTDNTFADLIINADDTTTFASNVAATTCAVYSPVVKTTFTLSCGTLDMDDFGAPVGSITSTSGDVTITGYVNLAWTTVFIDFGSETWTVGGAWTNSSTSASWDAGTGTVTFTSTASPTHIFASLGEAEFNNITINPASASTHTMGGTNTLSVAGAITVEASGTLAAGTNSIQFDRLDVNGTMTMDGITVPDIDINGTSGTILLNTWTEYTVASGIPTIRFSMNPSAAGSAITFIVSGLQADSSFSLFRDEIEVGTATSNGTGTWLFSFTGGWSPHDMRIGIPGTTVTTTGTGHGGYTVLWSWRHYSTSDLTVQFVVKSPTTFSTVEYVWQVGDEVLGEGSIFEHQFTRSGDYSVTLDVQIKGTSAIKSTQAVSVVSTTFFGQYMPIIMLVVLAVWYVVLLLGEVITSNGGRVGALVFILGLLGSAYLLFGHPYKTIAYDGADAMLLYIGMALTGVAGAARTRLMVLILGGVGLTLMFLVFRLIL
jgi:hypothetical protein